MKIFFVGIHNKPDMQPLDSRTRSGKIIDLIIQELPANECVKTNLCDTEAMPHPTELPNQNARWHSVNKPSKKDRIVLLGAFTHSAFERRGLKIIKLPHPASYFHSGKNSQEYINAAVSKIKDAITVSEKIRKHNIRQELGI